MKKFLLSALAVAAAMTASAAYEDFNKIIYLPMDEVGATLENKMGEAAALVEGPAAVATPGAVGGGAQFAGETYYAVPYSSQLNFGENDFSIEFLYKSTDAGLVGYAVMLGCNTDEGDERNGHWVGVEFKGSNILFAIKSNTAGKKSQAGLACLEEKMDGEWHHLIAVRDHVNATVDLYLDGVVADSKTDKTQAIDIKTPLYVGANPSPTIITETKPFTGALDELSVINGALSMSDVEARYEDLTTTGGVNEIIASMENAVVTVYNLNGVEVARGAGNVDSLVAGLDKDLYVIVVSNGTQSQVKKFIKK